MPSTRDAANSHSGLARKSKLILQDFPLKASAREAHELLMIETQAALGVFEIFDWGDLPSGQCDDGECYGIRTAKYN